MAAQDPKQKKIDSLERVLKLAKLDTSRVNIMNRLIDAYNGVDSLKAFQRGNEALRISKKIDYLKGIADAYIQLGGLYRDYSINEKAQEYLKEGIKFAEKLVQQDSSKANLKTWINGNYFLATSYGDQGQLEEEIELTDKVLPVAEAIGDSLFLANAHTNLGLKKVIFGLFDEAHTSISRGGAIYEALGNPEKGNYNRIQFAKLLYHMDSLDQMKKVLDKVKIDMQRGSNDFDRLNFQLEESLYYMATESYNKSLESLDKARKYVQGDENSLQSGALLQRYAFVYAKKNDFENAKKYASDYYDASKSRNDSLSMFQALYKRSEFSVAQKDFKSAYYDYVAAFDLYEAINTTEAANKYKEIELKYKKAENESAILKLENEKKESALVLEQRKSQTYLLTGIVSLLALLLLLGYFFYRSKLRKAKLKETEQVAEVNYLKQEQKNQIFSAMIEGQEKERKRLAIDLHDGLGGRLSGISMNLSKLDKDEPKKYPKKQLQKVMKDLDDSLTELRTIARNMMPETLVKFGLQAALKDYCSSMTGQDTKVTLQFYGNEKGIEPSEQVTMYRVIQELINNAIKHAKASEVLVQYMREGNQVDITVEDNGVGFKKEIVENKGSGMGLSNLRTRVAYLKGDLDFQSQENEGTTVNVHLTVDHNHAA